MAEKLEPPLPAEGSDKHKHGRLKNVNQIPAYEALFNDDPSPKKKKRGFLFRVFSVNKWKLLSSNLVYLLQAAPLWIMPLVTSDVIDAITQQYEGYIIRIIIDAVIFALCLAQNVPATMWRSSIANRMLRETNAGIKISVVRKLQRLSITYHKEMEGGKIQSKFLRDVEQIEAYHANIVHLFIPNLIGVIVSVVISLFKNPLVTLFFVAIVPLNVLNAVLFDRKMKSHYNAYRNAYESMSVKLSNMLQMLPLSKAHGLEGVENKQLKKEINTVKNAGTRVDKVEAAFGSLAWVISNLLSGVCLFFCVFLAIKGTITIGEVVLFQSLFASINGSVLSLIQCYPQLTRGRESVQSLSEIMTSDEMEKPGGDYTPAIRGQVDFLNVSYSYPHTDKKVVNGFNLHVNEGECIAVVGASGSGKSTVMNLIIGLLDPTEGQILIDGTPMNDISKDAYRHYLSVVPQNSLLFSGTLRENITYGLDHYTEEQLAAVVEAANVSEFLPLLPDGLSSNVGEHGDKLSGGQKQRVCIARALIRNPRILILDEATSALDNVSEYHVQQAIDRLVKERTTFIVAHRLSTIRNADRIVVMEDGQIAEVGTYAELVAKKGKFYELKTLTEATQKQAEEALS